MFNKNILPYKYYVLIIFVKLGKNKTFRVLPIYIKHKNGKILTMYTKSLTGNIKTKQPEKISIKEAAEKGRNITYEITEFMKTDKIKGILERIPKEDALFIKPSEVKQDLKCGFKASDPELIYCKNYYKGLSTKNLLKNMKEFTVSIQDGLDKKSLQQWLKNFLV